MLAPDTMVSNRSNLRQLYKHWLKELSASQRRSRQRRRQINASLSSPEYQLIAKAAEKTKRSPACQLKLMALAFARQNRVINEDFAPLAQDMRRLRSLADDMARSGVGWQKMTKPQLQNIADRADQWEIDLQRFLKLD